MHQLVFAFLLSAGVSAAPPGAPSSREKTPAPRGPAFINDRTDTIDGVSFTAEADKKTCRSGDSLRVRYRIRNLSMGTVVYDFATSCRLKLDILGADGGPGYSRLFPGTKSGQPDECELMPSQLVIPPSEEHILGPVAVTPDFIKSDTLTVKTQMAGYPLSAVKIKVAYRSALAPSGPVALEWSTENKPALDFNSETRMLILRVNRAQRLTISAFILTGKKINKLSCVKFLEPGTHQISFNNPKLADGVVIFKVEGTGFSETKTINLAR